MSVPNDEKEQKDDWYKVYNVKSNRDSIELPKTFLGWAFFIFVTSLIIKICFALWTSSMASSALFSIHGKISEIYIGGEGRQSYVELEPDGKVNQYKSFLGQVWPGMTTLKKGDLVDITAWEQGQAGEPAYRDPYPHYYIWQLTKGRDVIIRGDDISKLKSDSDNSINRFANWIMVFSSTLMAIAYIRHLRLRSDAKPDRK
jgi:hypothetical protein